MAKKKKYNPDFNACIGKHDSFGMIYGGMLKHEAFQKMSAGLQMFYVRCRVHANDEKAKRCLYKHAAEYQREYDYKTDFVFPATHLKEYGIDRSNASKMFRELQDRGFIVIKESNQHCKRPNVYSFSDKWKNTSQNKTPCV